MEEERSFSTRTLNVVGFGLLALTSDTAILAQAAPTTQMLTELAVREILCKPAIYSIGRGEKADLLIPELQAPAAGDKALEGEVLPPEKQGT